MAERRSLALKDLYRMRYLARPVLSPDGRFVVFGVTSFLEKENERVEHLHLVPLDGGPVHRLTRGKAGASAHAFSPDGSRIAFLSARPDEPEVAALRGDGEKESPKETAEEPKPKAQVWVLNLRFGGEARQVTRAEEGVESFDWSPDGREIVYAARAPEAGEKEYLKAIRDDEGPLVLRRVQHKYDGEGYLDEVKTQIFLADVESRAVRQLTRAPFNCRFPVFAPDGGSVAFVANCTGDEDQNLRRDIFLMDRAGGDIRRVTRGDVNGAGAEEPPAFSPDGRRVAFVSPVDPENAYLITHVMVAEVAQAVPVADLASAVGAGFASIGGVVPDGTPTDPIAHARVYPAPLARTQVAVPTRDLDRPVLGGLRWLDDETMFALVADRAQIKAARIRLSGAVDYLAPAGEFGSVRGADARAGHTVAILSLPDSGQDLYRIDGGAPVRLTHLAEDLLQGVAMPRMERLRFAAADGREVDAVALFPPGHPPGTPAPLMVQIHGGPMWFDSPEFDFDSFYFAQRGYAVLQVNYRGSISFGEDFCIEIQGRWGPIEHADVMAGVDFLIARGDADPEHLYVTGFSQGGIMTNWAVGHTDRFRAAVSEHGMWEYISSFGTDDCHAWWQNDLGVPWQNPEGYRAMSPASGAANIRTPLLITAGQEDWRCPLDQAEQLYMILRKRGVPTELVVYQAEHHAISKPRRAVDRLRRIGEWFARYGGPAVVAEDAKLGYPGPRGMEVKE